MTHRARYSSAFFLALTLTIPGHAVAAIRGSIMTTGGDPVAKARVRVFAPETSEERLKRLLSSATDRSPIASAETDDRGMFSAEAAKHSVIDVQIEASGFAPVLLSAEANENLGEIALRKAEMRSGSVKAGGKPLAGALVLFQAGERGTYDSGAGELAVTTGADGIFRVTDPFVWASSAIVIAHDFAPLTKQVAADMKQHGLGFTLDEGITVQGTVVEKGTSKGVSGAALLIAGWPSGRSGDNGSFTLKHVDASYSSITAMTPTMAGEARSNQARLVISVAPARRLSGIVRDSATNAPLSNSRVFISGIEQGGMPLSVLTRADGRFDITGLPPGKYSTFAMRPGYTMKVDTAGRETDLRTAALADRETLLQRNHRISGTVVDEQKHPVGGVFLTLMPKSSPAIYVYGAGMMSAGSFSSPDGSFFLDVPSMEGLEEMDASAVAAMEMDVIALKRGFAAGRSKSLKLSEIKGHASNIAIVLPKGVEVKGIVTDPEGHPQPLVNVGVLEEGLFGGVRYPVAMLFRQMESAEWNKTDADGQFSLLLNPKAHDLAFKKEGFTTATLRHVLVPAGQPIAVKLTRGNEIRGVVVRSDRTPVADATVSVSRGDYDTPEAHTSSEGTFAIADLEPGKYQLSVVKEDSMLGASLTAEAPNSALRIDVGATKTLRGRVIDAKAKTPLTAFEIRMSRPESEVTMESAGHGRYERLSRDIHAADGTWDVRDVPLGSYDVAVAAEGYVGKTVRVSVADGEPRADFELDPGATLRGRVTAVDSSPLTNVSVEIQGSVNAESSEMQQIEAVETDANGEYTIDGVAPGKVTVNFKLKGFTKKEAPVEITAAGARLDAVLSKGVKLRGIVTSGAARVASAHVSASPMNRDGDYESAETNDTGEFVIEGLGTGRYRLDARKKGFAPAELKDVDVEKTEPVELKLKKVSTATVFGRVTGIPAGDLMMQMVTVSGETGASGQSPIDAEGRYRIADAPAGHVHVAAYFASMNLQRQSRSKSVDVAANGETEVDIALNNDTILRGIVTQSGTPAIGVRLTFSAAGGLGSVSARADENGRYEIVGMEPGMYEVSAQSAAGGSFQTKYLLRGSSQYDIDMTGSAVRGSVVDASSAAPIKAASVTMWRVEGTVASNDSSGEVKTDAAGKFAAASIREGHYRLLVQKEGFGQEVQDVELLKGRTSEIAFRLRKAEGVKVRVVDGRDGHQLEGIVVVRDREKRVVANQPHTSPDGGLVIPLADGEYLLSASAHGYGSVTVPVTAPAGDVRIVVTPGGTLVVRSDHDLTGKVRLILPNGDEYVRCWCNGIADIQLSGSETRVENVTTGSYLMEVIDQFGVASRKYPVAITEGSTTTITIG